MYDVYALPYESKYLSAKLYWNLCSGLKVLLMDRVTNILVWVLIVTITLVLWARQHLTKYTIKCCCVESRRPASHDTFQVRQWFKTKIKAFKKIQYFYKYLFMELNHNLGYVAQRKTTSKKDSEWKHFNYHHFIEIDLTSFPWDVRLILVVEWVSKFYIKNFNKFHPCQQSRVYIVESSRYCIRGITGDNLLSFIR